MRWGISGKIWKLVKKKKKEILKLKTIIFEIENSLDELNSKLGTTEENKRLEKCIPYKH